MSSKEKFRRKYSGVTEGKMTLRTIQALIKIAAAIAVAAIVVIAAQAPASLILPENQVTRVSDHVSAIMGFPNIGIVVGSRATLVVDTGLGPRNGAIVARQAQKLGGVRCYTYNHALSSRARRGRGRVSANTIIVRPIAQQKELEDRGMQFVQRFSSRPRK